MHGGKTCGHGDDRVGDIMCARAGCAEGDEQSAFWAGNPGPAGPRDPDPKHMAYGGEVTDYDEELTGELPNEFDLLELEDPDFSKADYTGANSGDEKGNEGEDERRRAILRKIMGSRRSSWGQA